MKSDLPLHADLTVRGPRGFFAGDTRIRLLEAVARYGSITRAAKCVPLSYKAAWDAIDDMNNLAPELLVERSVGGRRGGGAGLTPYGVRMITLYRALERYYDEGADALMRVLEEREGASVDELQSLLSRLSLRTSARNQFIGAVQFLRTEPGDVDVEVTVQVDPGLALHAVVTADVVERLGIGLGTVVAVLVPASAVFLITGAGVRATARNHFSGRVLELHNGPVNAAVTMELTGRRTLTATITRAAVQDLGIVPGAQAQAMFKGSALLLQRLD